MNTINRPKLAVALATALCLGLMGCNVAPINTVPETSSTPIAGLLTLSIEGIGDQVGTAKATFSASSSSLNTRALTAVPDTGLGFVNRNVSFYDVGKPGAVEATRYTQATFDITNTSTRSFSNLSLVAIALSSTSVGGTAFTTITNPNGGSMASSAIARSMLPTHGMQTIRSGLGVNPSAADVQFFTPTEANSVQSGAASLTPPLLGNVLQYGFVAHNSTGGRVIGASGCSTPNCNKGVLTMSYKFPLRSPRVNNPWGFTANFVITNQSQTVISQSLEEQSQCTVLGETQFLPATTTVSETRTLAGSSYRGTNRLQLQGIMIATPNINLTLPPAIQAGSLDQSCFASGGEVITSVGTNVSHANAMVLTPEGKTIVVGGTTNGVVAGLLVGRFNIDGTADSSFGNAGITVTKLSKVLSPVITVNIPQGTAVALQDDGKIVVAGSVSGPVINFNIVSRAVLVRYNPDGSLDQSFGTTGIIYIEVSQGGMLSILNQAAAMRLQADGKILVAGTSNIGEAVVRYNSNGTIDSGFGQNGFSQVSFPVNALELQTDGNILLGGNRDRGAAFLLTRLLSTGKPDFTFRSKQFSGSSVTLKVLAIRGNSIFVAGTEATNFALLRLHLADGTLDLSFGTAGRVKTSISPGQDQANAIGIEPDGTIVLAGVSSNAVALARYNFNGSLETTFGTGGTVSIPLAGQANAVSIRPDGKIVVAGSAITSTVNGVALLQINP